jgi:hypothetical protein
MGSVIPPVTFMVRKKIDGAKRESFREEINPFTVHRVEGSSHAVLALPDEGADTSAAIVPPQN